MKDIFVIKEFMSDYSHKVTVQFNTHHTELKFSSPYIHWHSAKKLKCFHIDSILAVEHRSEWFNLLIFHCNSIKSYKFLLKSDPKDLTLHLTHLLYPIPRSLLIILNKKSGSGQSEGIFQKHFLPFLQLSPYKYEVIETQENLFDKVDKNFTDLIFFSGDGTVNKILTELYSKNPSALNSISIGVVPTGSRNSLAIELSGKSLLKPIFHILKSKFTMCDLMKVELDHEAILGTTAILIGLGADIPKEADDIRGLGPIRFPFVILRKLVRRWKFLQASVKYQTPEGNLIEKTSNFNGIFLGNHKAQNILNDEIPYPNASLDSGQLVGIFVENCSKLQAFRIFWQVMNSGQHLFNPNAQFFDFISLSVKAETPMNVSIDGEIFQSCGVQVSVWPKAVRFFGNLRDNR